MDLVLSRQLADRGVFPAINIELSNTRHQELLFDDEEMQNIWQLRKALHAMDTEAATETLITGLRQSKTNADFMAMAKQTFRAKR